MFPEIPGLVNSIVSIDSIAGESKRVQHPDSTPLFNSDVSVRVDSCHCKMRSCWPNICRCQETASDDEATLLPCITWEMRTAPLLHGIGIREKWSFAWEYIRVTMGVHGRKLKTNNILPSPEVSSHLSLKQSAGGRPSYHYTTSFCHSQLSCHWQA